MLENELGSMKDPLQKLIGLPLAHGHSSLEISESIQNFLDILKMLRLQRQAEDTQAAMKTTLAEVKNVNG